MSEKWISVELSETSDVLTVLYGGAFLKEETDEMMSGAYKMISNFAERIRTSRTEPERVKFLQSYSVALAFFEAQLHL